jgi:hypothetical protein
MIKSIEVGGVLMPIHFSFNALATFGKLTGLNVSQMERLSTGMEFDHIIALTYAGLKDGNRKARQEDPTIPVFAATLEDVGDWLSENPGMFADIFFEFADAQARPVVEKKSEPAAEAIK